jgi:hypothetical protein
MFRVFRGSAGRTFFAVKTCWRRGKDSNPRYRSEWRKSRPLRKLQGINLLSETERRVVLRRCGKPVRFPIQSKGEWLAILWLKVVSRTALKRPNWFARDCVPAAQSESEKYLRRMCSSKGEWLAIFRDSCPCFVTRLPPIDRQTSRFPSVELFPSRSSFAPIVYKRHLPQADFRLGYALPFRVAGAVPCGNNGAACGLTG